MHQLREIRLLQNFFGKQHSRNHKRKQKREKQKTKHKNETKQTNTSLFYDLFFQLMQYAFISYIFVLVRNISYQIFPIFYKLIENVNLRVIDHYKH